MSDFQLEEVRHLYDRRAPFYDSIVATLSLGKDGRYRKKAVEALEIGPAHRVLDVGCGTGLNFSRLPSHVVGIDPSAGLLRIARRRAKRLAMGTGQSLPFPDASFDRVLSTYVLTTVPDWPRALNEMARVLRPGGRLVLTDDRLPPGWFLGPGPMFRKIFGEGWTDIHRGIVDEFRTVCTDVTLRFFHFGLIYLVSGVRKPGDSEAPPGPPPTPSR